MVEMHYIAMVEMHYNGTFCFCFCSSAIEKPLKNSSFLAFSAFKQLFTSIQFLFKSSECFCSRCQGNSSGKERKRSTDIRIMREQKHFIQKNLEDIPAQQLADK